MTLAEEIAQRIKEKAEQTGTNSQAPVVETVNTSSLGVKSGSGF